jgi:CHAT domain-containing protein/Tfp pilus assembly protein PilF
MEANGPATVARVLLRAGILVSLFVPLLADSPAPWADRAYRKTFDQLMTDGRYVEAEANARSVLADAEARHGRESIETALALEMLTEVYFQGDHVRDPEGEEIGLRVIAIKQQLLGAEHPQVAVSMRLFANLLSTKADYERARPFYERAIAIYEKTPGADPRREAYAYTDFGEMLTKSGDFAGARSMLERALTIQERYFAPDNLNTAGALVTYAVLLREMGDYSKSRDCFQRASNIYDKRLGPGHVMSVESLSEFGALLNRMGRAGEAKPLLETALAIAEKTYGPTHIDLAFVLNNLAAASASLGETTRARGLYERAIAIATPVYGTNHPDVARILAGYAALLLRLGENRLALDAALRTEQIGRDHLTATIRTLPERQALRYAATRATAIDVLLRIAAHDPSSRRSVFDALVRSRALVFDEMAARHRVMAQSNDPEIAHLWESLAAARERLSRLVVQGPGTFQGNRYAAALDHARATKEKAERSLAERSASFRRELVQREAGGREVAAALMPGDALVSFVRYGSDPNYIAFVQRAGEENPAVVPLGPAHRIEALVGALRRDIQAEAEAPGRARVLSESRYRNTGEALRQRLWDPLVPALGNARRVFITPDHEINLIDFAALPARQGGYLAEHGPLLHYLSAERDLIAPPATAPGSGLLAIGAPAFDRSPRGPQLVSRAGAAPVFRGSRAACSQFQALRFDPLPGSSREVRDIGAVWNKSDSGDVLERTGDAASESEFRQNAPGRRVVHIATHGFFMDEHCPSAAGAGENPLLLSGIALAGANRRSSASPETSAGDHSPLLSFSPSSPDGIVTAEEIAAMDLGGVEWAVLSACETGLGKLLPGEGVFGLRRAFQVAGARTVIMSLWPVDDVSTERWMTALYRKRFASRLGTAESVRSASREILAQRRARGLSTHPFYWAGFIAVGDWR